MKHPFPWVEFEAVCDCVFAHIGERLPPFIPSDLVNCQKGRVEAGLNGEVSQVADGHEVFKIFLDSGEPESVVAKFSPKPHEGFQKSFMDRVEL